MFISFEYIKYIGYNNITKEYSYQYKIIDSDFEVEAEGRGPGLRSQSWVAVIDVYEKQNLDVAANLMKAILYAANEYNYSINEIIE